MAETAVVHREALQGIFDSEQLKGSVFKVIIYPLSEAEAEEAEFKSLKGIAGRPLNIDEIRKERLHL